jgi:hypothetical protein
MKNTSVDYRKNVERDWLKRGLAETNVYDMCVKWKGKTGVFCRCRDMNDTTVHQHQKAAPTHALKTQFHALSMRKRKKSDRSKENERNGKFV